MTTNAIDPRRVEYKPIDELIPDPRNPKAHDQDTIDDSIGRFGVLDLIVQDQRTGYIVSGHGRRKALAAMQERGETPPEGVKVGDGGEWLVPVVTGWASRTDAEAGAALIALNRTTELGGWVDDALLDLLDELNDIEDGLVGVGFSDTEIDNLRKYIGDMEIATTFGEQVEPVLEDIDDDRISVSLHEGLVTINVIVHETDRPRLYDLLKDVEWIEDVRDARA